jgi:ubiquitin-conjugating enzyme E2 D/E
MITRIFHPGFSKEGIPQLKIDREEFNPSVLVKRSKFYGIWINLLVLEEFVQLLVNPGSTPSMNADIENIFRDNRVQFEETAREWTKKYAMSQV